MLNAQCLMNSKHPKQLRIPHFALQIVFKELTT